jgi:triosephosphate isomerase
MRQKIVAGNWKMNKTLPEAIELVNNLHETIAAISLPAHVDVVLCPPFPYLAKLNDLLLLLGNDKIGVGAQNCHQAESGAYTGEVSAAMLSSLGAKYVIIGHSERRSYNAESHELLRQKTDIALKNGLQVIFCCGENLQQREADEHFDLVSAQLRDSLFHLEAAQWEQIIVAYEPVWAIGTGKTATPQQAQAMHAHIRQFIAQQYSPELANQTTILYGGSCNAANADELFACPDIDGGLIGGASLKAKDFAAIVAAII